jgi:hypothetical protein
MSSQREAASVGQSVRGDRGRSASAGPAPAVAAVVRRQTPEEERRFGAAVDALLSELVRRGMGRRGECNERKGT